MKSLFSTILMLFVTGIVSFSQTIREVRSTDRSVTLEIRNDDYAYHRAALGGEHIVKLEGFESSRPQEFRFPAATYSIDLPGAGVPTLRLEDIHRIPVPDAHPFYYTAYFMGSDSLPEGRDISFFNDRNRIAPQSLAPSGIRSIPTQTGTRVRFQLPLIAWNEEERSTSFVESFRITITFPTDERTLFSGRGPVLREISFSDMDKDALYYVDTTGSWIDYGREYIRFAVRADGMAKITKSWFQSHGVNVSAIDPTTVKLWLRGEQIPLGERGTSDGLFDDADYFFFHGTRNYGAGDYRLMPDKERACPEYIDKYGDSTIYWISWGGVKGARAIDAAAGTPAGSDSLLWYAHAYHFENDNSLQPISIDILRKQKSKWTSQDTWFMQYISQNQTIGYSVPVENLHPGMTATARVKIFDWTPGGNIPAHIVTLALNQSATIDSAVFSGDEQAILSGSVNPADLVEGNNTLRVSSLQPASNTCVVDWIELEYPRQLKASNNGLSIPVIDNRMAGYRLLRVRGFSDTSIQVFKTRKGVSKILPRLMLNTGSGYDCIFVDTVAAGDRYELYRPDDIASAPPGRRLVFRNLRDSGNGADYILITHSRFSAGASQYASFINREYSLRVATLFVDEIYDEFGYGFFAAEPIKAFLIHCMKYWSGAPPRYVLLLGDANYNYRTPNLPYGTNYVPTYGFPSGDGWFVCFDPDEMRPSLQLGRIPVRSNEEVLRYLDKHGGYVNQSFDAWNKTFFLYSGGLPKDGQAGLDELRFTNDRVGNTIVKPAPFGGRVYHYYKTLTPQSDFGPVDPEEYRKTVEAGALCISYLGHSGTATWDNSIIEASQLDNKSGRNPLITDFGCSTGKFAEPNLVSFSEHFLLDPGSQAIGYIGNSSLGFSSLTARLPILFYQSMIQDSLYEISGAHLRAKQTLVDRYGASLINQIAVHSNVLIGDPVISLPIPTRPNLVVERSWIDFETKPITNKDDSILVNVPLANYGRVTADSVDILIEDRSGGSLLTDLVLRVPQPLFMDTLRIAIPTLGISGSRLLRVIVDPANLIDELSRADNLAEYAYEVLNTSMQVVNVQQQYVGGRPDSITVLNPVFSTESISSVLFEFDRSDAFTMPVNAQTSYGKVFSRLHAVPGMQGSARVFWRVRPEGSSDPSGPYTYVNDYAGRGWVANDSAGFASMLTTPNMVLTPQGFRLQDDTVSIRVISSGFYDGNSAVVERNGFNILAATYDYQYYVVVLDSVTLEKKREGYYKTWKSADDRDSLNAMLTAATFGEIVIVTTADEPNRGKNVFTDALKELGSVYIDSIGGWSSYALIGRRGVKPGTVPEYWKKAYEGNVVLDTAYYVPPYPGSITTEPIGPAFQWNKAYASALTASGTSVRIDIIGLDGKGGSDTLLVSQSAPIDSIDISGIDAKRYPYIRMKATLLPRAGVPSPLFRGWSVRYAFLPELALNYQSVHAMTDSVGQGGDFQFQLGVTNPGPSPASAFSISVEAVDQNNVRRPVTTLNVPGLEPDAWYESPVVVPTTTLQRDCQVIVSVDPAGEVLEQYENNNTYVLPFYVRPDTTRPSLEATFDGYAVMDGDYIQSLPEVRVSLTDPGPFPINGLENFTLFVDDTLLTTQYEPTLRFEPGSGDLKGAALFQHHLENGQHHFRFTARDANGNYADTLEFFLYVENESSVRDFYNFPNPFSESTSFSFVLTGTRPPDEFKIKIYTVAGRMIREIAVSREQLRIGYNTFEWDGRDEDGDRLGNGVYFYKVHVSREGRTESSIGKIAIVR